MWGLAPPIIVSFGTEDHLLHISHSMYSSSLPSFIYSVPRPLIPTAAIHSLSVPPPSSTPRIDFYWPRSYPAHSHRPIPHQRSPYSYSAYPPTPIPNCLACHNTSPFHLPAMEKGSLYHARRLVSNEFLPWLLYNMRYWVGRCVWDDHFREEGGWGFWRNEANSAEQVSIIYHRWKRSIPEVSCPCQWWPSTRQQTSLV